MCSEENAFVITWGIILVCSYQAKVLHKDDAAVKDHDGSVAPLSARV